MNALTARMRAPRTFGSQVARVLVPRLALFGALSSALLVGNAMSLSPSAAPLEQLPVEVPTWSAAERAAEPDCIPESAWPAGEPAAAVVVHRFDEDRTVRMDFADAWDVNHNQTETDDVWVLGICR